MPHWSLRHRRLVLLLALVSLLIGMVLTNGHELQAKHIGGDPGCALCITLADLGQALPGSITHLLLDKAILPSPILRVAPKALGYVLFLPSRAPPRHA